MAAPADKRCEHTDWLTPPRVIRAVMGYFGTDIPLDPASSEDNPTGATRWYWPPEYDGLAEPWDADGVFVNPPYGKVISDWLHKIALESFRGGPILALLPVNRTEQPYMQAALSAGNAVCWVRKRLAFYKPTGEKVNGNMHASLLLGVNVGPCRFMQAFSGLGTCQMLARL
jgi:hypothetical protein